MFLLEIAGLQVQSYLICILKQRLAVPLATQTCLYAACNTLHLLPLLITSARLLMLFRLVAAPDTFDKVVTGGKHALIEFYAPW